MEGPMAERELDQATMDRHLALIATSDGDHRMWIALGAAISISWFWSAAATAARATEVLSSHGAQEWEVLVAMVASLVGIGPRELAGMPGLHVVFAVPVAVALAVSASSWRSRAAAFARWERMERRECRRPRPPARIRPLLALGFVVRNAWSALSAPLGFGS
jgi:hypothetical protein